jgi:hypothetical protein
MAKQYKDWYTLDGRLKPAAGVTKRKVEAVRDLVDDALKGSRIALGTLTEAVTTSDASLSLAHLVNIEVLPEYDEAPRTWQQVADRARPVSDFRPVTLVSLSRSWDDGVLGSGDPVHVSPTVPEGAPYPYAFFSEEETSQTAAVKKRGFKFRFTFEAFINDALGTIRELPDQMLQVALDTEEYEFYNALIGGLGAGQQLDGGTIPDGTVVAANAKLHRASLIQAISELKRRQINGRYITVKGGFNLLVQPGQAEYANFILNNLTLDTLQTGALTFNVNGYNPLGNITVVETEYVTSATAWYLVPKPGTSRRPVASRLNLIGHESPELRVQNLTGTYLGGGSVSPFEGDFDTDSAEFRLRQIGGAALWTPDLVVWSTGAGAVPTPPA